MYDVEARITRCNSVSKHRTARGPKRDLAPFAPAPHHCLCRLNSIPTRTDNQVTAHKWLTAALLVAAQTPLGAQAKPDWVAFDKYVAKAAAEWRVPALAIAVVKDDSVIFAKGYGVLEKGKSQ